MLIDSHAHLTGERALISEEELQRAHAAGVEMIINICTDAYSLQRGLELAKRSRPPCIITACATTPHDVAKEGDLFFPEVEACANKKLLQAIGETGLDYHYMHSPKDVQQTFLRKYLRLARSCSLPVVIHCRDAFEDFCAIWDEEQDGTLAGVLHCFTGTMQEAEKVLQRGMYVSISGIVTFEKSTALQAIVQAIPLDRLLIETDAPYLAPQPFRGKKNEPAYLVETAKYIAKLRSISLEELAASTTQNVKQLFRTIL
jgi:TatD DNase family protein